MTMNRLLRPLTLVLLFGLNTLAAAESALTEFASDDGLVRLARSAARSDFAPLANQFEPQYNNTFCGPTAAAIVLNALYAGRRDLPRDRSRLREADARHLPPGADISLPRFTQDNVIERGAKSRAQVLGEPIKIGDKTIKDFGYQLAQFEELLRANGARARKVVVDEQLPEATIRADLIGNLQRGGDYVIVNYLRSAVGQSGGGHLSPLGAYDAATDSFLVLDVNPGTTNWVWTPAATLIAAMRTFDTVENRGYVLVGRE
jgi:hypothetical protein